MLGTVEDNVLFGTETWATMKERTRSTTRRESDDDSGCWGGCAE